MTEALGLTMISYVTKSELRSFADQLSLSERVELRKSAASRPNFSATFLSHSSKDDDLVVGAIRVLENHGAHVYIDKVDPTMPPYTTATTAKLLKERIAQSSRFVLLASKNSQQSTWVPWELGIADGSKGMDRIALFPAVESQDDRTWTSWEYLGLYHRIVWGNLEGYSDPLWMVLNEKEHTATRLREWLGS